MRCGGVARVGGGTAAAAAVATDDEFDVDLDILTNEYSNETICIIDQDVFTLIVYANLREFELFVDDIVILIQQDHVNNVDDDPK